MDLLRAGLFCIVKRFRYPREAIGCLGGGSEHLVG